MLRTLFAGGHPGCAVSPKAGEQQPAGERREERYQQWHRHAHGGGAARGPSRTHAARAGRHQEETQVQVLRHSVTPQRLLSLHWECPHTLPSDLAILADSGIKLLLITLSDKLHNTFTTI